MVSRIIAVANHKGGCGRTTVSMSLAGAIAGKGQKVLVVDADPQGTASQWAAAASEEMPFPATVINLDMTKSELHAMLRPMIDDYDYIVIDCPSHEDQVSLSALLISDVCLIPLQPTAADLWGMFSILKLVEMAQTVNKELRAYGVANLVSNSRLGKRVMFAMAKEVALMDAKLGKRTSFMEATLYGTTPQKMGYAHKTAAKEIVALVDEIFLKMVW